MEPAGAPTIPDPPPAPASYEPTPAAGYEPAPDQLRLAAAPGPR